jgi:ring-1,2-phenylacetyl-CoA epoxidase subunit PaaB
MTDSQWPRFEVFLQEKPGRPHQYVGSVHATDPDLALLNARDVFVRRPECTSLWVAPAEAVCGGTAEQLATGQVVPSAGENGAAEEYLVFAKLEQRGTLTHTGQVRAAGRRRVAAARQGRRPLVIGLSC